MCNIAILSHCLADILGSHDTCLKFKRKAISYLIVSPVSSIDYLNAFSAAGECRRQVKNAKNYFKKNVNIVEFHNDIWNHHEKYIQISTNIPGYYYYYYYYCAALQSIVVNIIGY